MKAGFRFFSKRYFKQFASFLVVLILSAGCGDGDGNGVASTGTQGTNSAGSGPGSGPGGGSSGGSGSGGSVTLDITGTPPSQIVAGTIFIFTPTVQNPDDVELTFSATNLPSWASINRFSGMIRGAPSSGDVGTYSGIQITVSGGGTSDTSRSFTVEVVDAAVGSATLSWEPPTQQTDGSPLNDLAGYRIYYGQSQNNLNQIVTVNNPGITTYVVENLTPATWYFAATAYDADGMESSFSNSASKTIQ